jgi:predicted RNA-binding Zn ribbon-like protein
MLMTSLPSHLLSDIKQLIADVGSDHQAAAKKLKSWLDNMSDKRHIVRTVTVKEAWNPAALSLLDFLYTYLQWKHADKDIRVSVEQSHEGLTVAITVPEALHDAVEASLEAYSLALRQKIPLSDLVSNKTHLIVFKQRLDLSVLELGLHGEESLGANPMEAMTAQSRDVFALHAAVGESLSAVSQLRTIVKELLSSEKGKAKEALEVLAKRLEGVLAAEHEAEVKQALSALQAEEPDVFEQIRNLINQGSVSGKAGDYLYGWISAIAGTLPR